MNFLIPPFDLIVEPLPDGMVLVGVRLDAGLDELVAHFDDRDDYFALRVLCGDCAKDLLTPLLLERPAPSLFVGQANEDGVIVPLDTHEERHALLGMLGEHVH
jgi:hypothetical protein